MAALASLAPLLSRRNSHPHSWSPGGFLIPCKWAFALSPLVLSASLHAQSTAALSGTVTDPSGALLPGAQIVVHGIATGTDRTVTSDSAGNYAVPSLQPGNYRVTVSAPGFAPYQLTSIALEVDQNVTANAKLGLASAGEVVQVEGAAPILDAQTITVGQVIDQKTVQEIPLNGRHFLDLTNLTPGTVVPPVTGSLTGASRGLGANSFDTAGQREDTVNFMINGINLNDLSQNQITFQPSVNTTSEFKLSNSTYSAEYGRSSGSIVNVATRSGTNALHGEAFDYLRNNYFDARNYFNRKPNPQNKLIRNNFGGALSGPVLKDRTFYFLSYEGLRQQQAILFNNKVLTAAQRQQLLATPGYGQLANLIPAATDPTGTLFQGSEPGPVKIDQFSADLLHTISQQDNIHAYYAWQQDARTEPNLQGNTIPGFGDHRTAHRQIGTINEVHIFSTNVVNEARLGFNRIAISFVPNTPENPAAFGIDNGVAFNAALPQIVVQDIGLNFGGPAGFPQGRFDTTGVFSDTLSWNLGRNTVRGGGVFRRFVGDSFSQTAGNLTFATTPAFLAGLANSFNVTPTQVTSRIFENAAAGFASDNYKVTQRFQAEIGFRFEWNGTPTDGGGRLINFDQASGALVHVREAYNQNYNYEPRVGFIWDVRGNNQTVLRGGYGVMADEPSSGVVTGLAGNPPDANPVSVTAPSTSPGLPVGTLYTLARSAAVAPSATNPNFKNGYAESYNLNLQQQLGASVVMEAGYIGSENKHLRIVRNVNQFLYAPGATAGTRPYAKWPVRVLTPAQVWETSRTQILTLFQTTTLSGLWSGRRWPTASRSIPRTPGLSRRTLTRSARRALIRCRITSTRAATMACPTSTPGTTLSFPAPGTCPSTATGSATDGCWPISRSCKAETRSMSSPAPPTTAFPEPSGPRYSASTAQGGARRSLMATFPLSRVRSARRQRPGAPSISKPALAPCAATR